MSDDEAICRVNDNLLETGTIPIVFVPGVMGSRLDFTAIGQKWDPNSTWAMSHWLTASAETSRREFALDNPAVVMNTHKSLTQAQRDRGWAGVAWSFYGQFVRDLDAQTFGRYHTPVYVIGYDWRQNNRDSGNAVATRIDEILTEQNTDRFILISHSMGGLVTRACLKGHPELAAKLMGVIHIAQPVDGGLVLVRRMFTGAVPAVDGGSNLARVLGNTRHKFQTIMSALPGPMQLLSTHNYRDTGDRWWYDYSTFEEPAVKLQWEGNAWDLYLAAASPPGLLAPATESYGLSGVQRRQFTRRVREARRYHNWIGRWKHAKTWAINSTGLEVDMRLDFELPPLSFTTSGILRRHTATRADGTEVRVSDPNPANRGNIMRRRNESDGTVPITSAEALFPGQRHAVAVGSDYTTKKQFRIRNAAHDAICHNPNCERALFDIMRHILAG